MCSLKLIHISIDGLLFMVRMQTIMWIMITIKQYAAKVVRLHTPMAMSLWLTNITSIHLIFFYYPHFVNEIKWPFKINDLHFIMFASLILTVSPMWSADGFLFHDGADETQVDLKCSNRETKWMNGRQWIFSWMIDRLNVHVSNVSKANFCLFYFSIINCRLQFKSKYRSWLVNFMLFSST